MKRTKIIILSTILLTAAIAMGCQQQTQTGGQARPEAEQATSTPIPNAIPNVIPYTLEFEPVVVPETIPTLHAYSWAPAKPGGIYVLGGRTVSGLHMFTTGANNFPNPNTVMWWINPAEKKALKVIDFRILENKEITDALSSTNQQGYYDASSGYWYIAGGYGIDSKTGKFKTFDTLVRIPMDTVDKMVQAPSITPEMLKSLELDIEIIHNPLFQVTGGALHKTTNYFVLLFGQNFDGAYNPFGSGFTQNYTEQIRYFQVKAGKLAVFNTGKLDENPMDPKEAGKFHRRDLPVTMTVDPASGSPRVVAFGGVFPSGLIAGYTDAIYVQERFGQIQKVVDDNLDKRFSQYQCPTIPVYDGKNKVVYYTFFGGIGHYWYFQTPSQNKVYQDATNQGRNDGLPFVADITTVISKSDGSYAEYIAPTPIPGTKLHGASIDFIPNPGSGKFLTSEVVDLSRFAPGERTLIGYIFGGIEADNPLPVVPNTGTRATNAIYKVWLNMKPWAGLPAAEGHEAVGKYNHVPTGSGN